MRYLLSKTGIYLGQKIFWPAEIPVDLAFSQFILFRICPKPFWASRPKSCPEISDGIVRNPSSNPKLRRALRVPITTVGYQVLQNSGQK